MGVESRIQTRDAFLWLMNLIYLFAFTSLYVQIPGLYGDNGILPARNVLDPKWPATKEELTSKPTVLWLAPLLGLDVSSMMELTCLVGMIIAFGGMITKKLRVVLTFFLLWALYFSLYQVGQTFLWFQWDILLLEAGFLTIFVAPLLPHKRVTGGTAPFTISFWLVRWLLFRLMFASGIVKLTSECPTWWGLTALNSHYESQCIPTALAWYAHQLPEWFQKLCVIGVYVIEIPIPFLFFAPLRSLRLFSFYAQVFLQLSIILTGNYNFFNLLTIALCFSLLDDRHLALWCGRSQDGEERSSPRGQSGVWRTFSNLLRGFVSALIALAIVGLLALWTWKLFALQFMKDEVRSKITFTLRGFSQMLGRVIPLTIWIGFLSLSWQVISNLLRVLFSPGTCFSKVKKLVACLLLAGFAFIIFNLSLVPHISVDESSQNRVPAGIRKLHDSVKHLHLVNSYGLFRRMTGVEGRPEIVVEGSNSLETGWQPYEFFYKPGALSRSPPVVAPHQPRLDWQMWFAALGTYNYNPWFLNLVYRLLNNQPEVLELIQSNPFPQNPPKYIRATLYLYHYTAMNKNATRFSDTDWWWREKKSEYLPPVDKSNPSFVNYLKQYGVNQAKFKRMTDNTLSLALKTIRNSLKQLDGFKLCLSLFTAAGVLQVAKRLTTK